MAAFYFFCLAFDNILLLKIFQIQFIQQVQAPMSDDSDEDGYLDVSIISQFNIDQPEYITSRSLNATAIDGRCSAPLNSSACEINTPSQNSIATIASESKECLAPIEDTAGGYSPTPITLNASYFAAEKVSSGFSIGGVTINHKNFSKPLVILVI